jgi:hypothetical protein
MSRHLSPLDVQLALEGALPAREASHLLQCRRCSEHLAQEARLDLLLLRSASFEAVSEKLDAAEPVEGPDASWDDISQVRDREAARKLSHGVCHAALAVACSLLPWVSMSSQEASGVFAPGASPAFVLFQPWLR